MNGRRSGSGTNKLRIYPKKKAIEFDRIRIQIIVQKMIPQCEKQDYLTSVYYLLLSSFLYLLNSSKYPLQYLLTEFLIKQERLDTEQNRRYQQVIIAHFNHIDCMELGKEYLSKVPKS